jgi:metacaspase-1
MIMIKAVIVGINQYPQSPLQGCVNDAQDVIEHLTNVLGVSHACIVPLYDGRATKRAIVESLRDAIATSSHGDQLLFHYSGHGSQMATLDQNEPDGLEEILCPVDFDWSDPATALTDNELGAILATVPSGATLTVVLDSCHSGDMSRDNKVTPRFLPMPSDMAHRLASRARVVRTRALTRLNAAVVTACKSGETAVDTWFNGRANGAFTYQWLAALTARPAASLDALVAAATVPLASFNMHPGVEGSDTLARRSFLGTSLTSEQGVEPRVMGRAPAQVVFDEEWNARVLGLDISVGLQIVLVNGAFELELSSLSGLPLRWTFQVSGDTCHQVELGFGFGIILKISNWNATGNELRFELAISVKPPFFAAVMVTRQGVALPMAPVSRASTELVSPADLLAMIELSQRGHPAAPTNLPQPSLPRGIDNQWTGIAHVQPFSGGLFGARLEMNVNAYVPPGFVRDHIEVTLDPPNSGNVYFVRWEDSDAHIGRFQFHVGCPPFGGGVATFYMHCARELEVSRTALVAPAPQHMAEVAEVRPRVLSNGDSRKPLMTGAGAPHPASL